METIKFRRVLCIMALTPGLMVLGGCESGSSTVPTSATAAGTPPATSTPTPKPTPAPAPAPKPTPAPAPAPAPAPTGSLSTTVSWNAPGERLNGTSMSFGELVGYKIYYGTSMGSYPYVINVQDRTATSYKLNGLAAKTTYYVVVRSYDTAGNESANSNVVMKAL